MENIKEMMEKIEGEDTKGACGYNWAIGICLTVYLGLMVFLWLGSMRAQYVWDVIVQTTLVMEYGDVLCAESIVCCKERKAGSLQTDGGKTGGGV